MDPERGGSNCVILDNNFDQHKKPYEGRFNECENTLDVVDGFRYTYGGNANMHRKSIRGKSQNLQERRDSWKTSKAVLSGSSMSFRMSRGSTDLLFRFYDTCSNAFKLLM